MPWRCRASLKEPKGRRRIPSPGETAAGAESPPLRPIAVPSSLNIRGLGSPSTAPAAPLTPIANPDAAAHLGELNRVTAPPLVAQVPRIGEGGQFERMQPNALAHTKADTGQSGIGQIHNPFARHGLQVLDAIGSSVIPNVLRFIPGTELHHRDVVGEAQGSVNQDEAQATGEATRQHLGAETTELGARAANEQSEAAQRGQPAPRTGDPTKTIETADGIKQFNPDTGKYDIPVGEAPGKNATQHVVSTDGSVIAIHTNAKTGETTHEIVYKGDPKVNTELTKLQVNGKPHTVVFDKSSNTVVKDLGETGEKPPVVNVNSGNSALDHEIGQYGKPWQTMSTGVSGQLDKILDAEKMVAGGAEQQALGIPKILTALVSGQGSGVRITQAEMNNIAKARGIGGDIEGWFNKIRGKGQLTNTQQQQLNNILGDVRERILQKKAIADGAINEMQAGRSREDVMAADKKAREALDTFERSGNQGSSPAQGGYIVGKYYQGQKYLGGDPKDAKNWGK